MYVRKEGQCVSALQNICVFQYCASFWYHDPCTYVVAARVLPNRLSEQDLKQVTQRNHRVAVVGGNDFLQTEKSFTKRKACLSRESKDRKNNKLKVHMHVDVLVQSDTGRGMLRPMECRATLEQAEQYLPLLTIVSISTGSDDMANNI